MQELILNTTYIVNPVLKQDGTPRKFQPADSYEKLLKKQRISYRRRETTIGEIRPATRKIKSLLEDFRKSHNEPPPETSAIWNPEQTVSVFYLEK
jgi:hypothetical protein